jgi:hypothetical protein
MIQLVKICLVLSAVLPVALSTWWKLDGKALDVSAKGNELWYTSQSQEIFRWCHKTNDWVKQPGSAVRVGASPDGNTWIVNNADEVSRMADNGQWERIHGQPMMQVSAISKDKAIGVNRRHAIWLYEKTGWRQLPGAAMWACIGEMDERWVVNGAHDIFRWNHARKNWDHIPGKAVNIDCQNPERVIVTNAQNEMYMRVHNVWQRLPGAGQRSSVSDENSFTITEDGDIYVLDDGMHKGGRGSKRFMHQRNHHVHSHSHSRSREQRVRDSGRDRHVTVTDRDRGRVREQVIFEVPIIDVVEQAEVEDEFKIVMIRE